MTIEFTNEELKAVRFAVAQDLEICNQTPEENVEEIIALTSALEKLNEER